MKCPVCGNELTEISPFCPYCGSDIRSLTYDGSANHQPQPEQSAFQQPQPEQAAYQQSQPQQSGFQNNQTGTYQTQAGQTGIPSVPNVAKKNNRALIIVIAIIATVAIGSFATAFVVSYVKKRNAINDINARLNEGTEADTEDVTKGVTEDDYYDTTEYYDEDEYYETTEGVTAEETYDDTEEDYADYDLNWLEVNAAMDFVNGIGWLRQNGEISAVTTEGKNLFTLDSAHIVYVSPFKDDMAFVVYRNDDKTFYEDIMDKDGNVLYTTTTEDTSTDLLEDHIICQGDKEFLVLRHESGMSEDHWVLGTIDSSGNVVCDFKECIANESWGDVVMDEDSLPDWMNDAFSYHRDEGYWMPNTYYSYKPGASGGYRGELPRYHGNGIYSLPDQSLLVRPKDGNTLYMCSGHGEPIGNAVGNQVIINDGNSYYKADMDTCEAEQIVSVGYGSGKITGFASTENYRNGLFYADHNYYDINGNSVIELSDYEDMDIRGSAFYGDYAMLKILGEDKNTYVTVIDKNGEQQFEPFKTDAVSFNMYNGYFASCSDYIWTLYDHSGNSVVEMGEFLGGCYLNDGIAILKNQGVNAITYQFEDYDPKESDFKVEKGVEETTQEHETIGVDEPNQEIEEGANLKDDPSAVYPDDAVSFGDHHYKVYYDTMTWQEAEDYCADLGGHLISINSADEQSFAEGLTEDNTDQYNVWIGGYLDSDETWKWTDGSEFSYTNWDVHYDDDGNELMKPDNLTGTEFYIRFPTRTIDFDTWITNKGKWDDQMNDSDLGTDTFCFICEWNK